MTLMSAGERQLMRHIIEERDERIKASHALWAKLEDLQQQVSAVRAAPPVASSTLGIGDAHEVEAFRAELAAQRNQLASQRSNFDESLEVLRSGLRRAEMEAQEDSARTKEDIRALSDKVDREVKELRAKAGKGGKEEQAADAGRSRPWEAAQREAAEREAAELQAAREEGNRANAKFDEQLEMLQGQVQSVEERQQQQEELQQQQAKDVSALRAVLIEVHGNLPLHAVRASRIALRSTDLSKEERKLALASLESKENQIRLDLARARESGPLPPADALSQLSDPGVVEI